MEVTSAGGAAVCVLDGAAVCVLNGAAVGVVDGAVPDPGTKPI